MQIWNRFAAGVVSRLLFAIPVLLLAGSLSDHFGRKRVAITFFLVSVVGPLCFFFLARGAFGLFAALAVVYIGDFGAWPTGNAFGSEVFPTSLRAVGAASTAVAKSVGQFLSFALAAALIVVIAVGLPETGGRELEAIAGDEAAAAIFGVLPPPG